MSSLFGNFEKSGFISWLSEIFLRLFKKLDKSYAERDKKPKCTIFPDNFQITVSARLLTIFGALPKDVHGT